MTLRALALGPVPDAILARGSKASFNAAFWSDHAQRFADQWTGEGVDPELVDVDKLPRAVALRRAQGAQHGAAPAGLVGQHCPKKKVAPNRPNAAYWPSCRRQLMVTTWFAVSGVSAEPANNEGNFNGGLRITGRD